MQSAALERALALADEIEEFSLEDVGPSDDPEEQTEYIYALRDVAKRFVGAARRVGDPDLSELVATVDTSPELITDAYDLKANLVVAIDYLRDAIENSRYESDIVRNATFLDPQLISQLKSVQLGSFDVGKLIRFCEELNDAYGRGNYLACILLIRAVMNHVPPIFGEKTFAHVVAKQGRSVKAVMSRLEDEARPIGDLHNHALIRSREPLPSKHQVEPYKASFEILRDSRGSSTATRFGVDSRADATTPRSSAISGSPSHDLSTKH